MNDCVIRSPKSGTGVLLVLGDMLHHNDNENATPASKHALDVLATIEETAIAMIQGLARCIEIALLHHSKVIVSVLRGNHDRDAYLIVLYSLAGIEPTLASRCNVKRVSSLFISTASA